MNEHLLFVALVAVAVAPETKPIATALGTWAVAVENEGLSQMKTAIFALLAVVAALGQSAFKPFPKSADIAPAIVVALLANTWLAYAATSVGTLYRIKY